MPGKHRTCIKFMIYLYNGGTPTEDAKGTIAFYDKGEKQQSKKSFNHWDEISPKVRKFVEEAGYIKRSDKDGWQFEKK